MDSQIIYLKNRFYKLDPMMDPAINSDELWADALFYNFEKDEWTKDHIDGEATIKSKLITNLNEKKWIRLVKRHNDGQIQFEQQGPFSDHEIFDMLKKSQAAFTDPLWKKGLSRWTPLAKIETFKGLQDIQKRLDDDSFTADILDSVIEMRRVENKHIVPPVFIDYEAPAEKVSEEVCTPSTVAEKKMEDLIDKSGHSFILPMVPKTFPFERLFFALGVTLIFLFFMIKFVL